MQALLGNVLDRNIAHAGYRAHNATTPLRNTNSGSIPPATSEGSISKREFKRRVAIELVVGHLMDDHRMSRNYLAYSSDDDINAMPAGVGHNFRRLIQWLRLLMLRILIVASFATRLKSA
jgi:IS5 family transposase